MDIIGQFGVGFYSAFMVGKEVRVTSRAYGSDEAWCWVSDGVEGYTIEAAERAEPRHRRGDCRLRTTLMKTNYDTLPFRMGPEEPHQEVQQLRALSHSDGVRRRRASCPSPKTPATITSPQFEHYTETETINSMIPIWKRSKSDVTEEEYNEFYKSDFHDFADPVRTIKVHAEGALTYDALHVHS